MKRKWMMLCTAAAMAVPALFAEEGDVLFFDELRDPGKSAQNYVSYYHPGKNGPQAVIDKKIGISRDGIKVRDSRLFSRKADFTDCDIQFEFMLMNDQVKDGKHHGFVGFEIHAALLPVGASAAEKEKDRSFRILCQIGKKMPMYDIRTSGKAPRRTACYRGMQMGKLPVMEGGRWYRMRLLCRNQTVTIYLDGNEIGKISPVSAADQFASSGRFALWGYAGDACFRNIQITDAGTAEEAGK